jgi:hypothetical protein
MSPTQQLAQLNDINDHLTLLTTAVMMLACGYLSVHADKQGEKGWAVVLWLLALSFGGATIVGLVAVGLS